MCWSRRSENCNLPDCYQEEEMVEGILPLDYRHVTSKYVDLRNLELLAFRREIMDIYLKRNLSPNQSGRQRGRILSAKHRVKDEIRLDRTDIFSSCFMTQKRCGQCGKNTR